MVNLAEIAPFIASGAAASGVVIQYFRTRIAEARIKQQQEDEVKGIRRDYSELKDDFEEHLKVADTGWELLHKLQVGMSDGAAAGFRRVETAIGNVLVATTENGKQISELTGQLKGLATLVGQLVEVAMKDHA